MRAPAVELEDQQSVEAVGCTNTIPLRIALSFTSRPLDAGRRTGPTAVVGKRGQVEGRVCSLLGRERRPLSSHVRPHPTGIHRVDEDAVLSQRRRGDSRDRVHGRLRDPIAQAVAGEQAVAGLAVSELAGPRGENDDSRASCGTEWLQQRLREKERSEDVHVQDLLEDLALDLVERRVASGIGRRVVDEHMQLGRRYDRLLRDRRDTVLRRELAEDRGAAEFVGSGLRVGLPACVAENAGSFRGERTRDRRADPPRGAGDERVPAAQSHVADPTSGRVAELTSRQRDRRRSTRRRFRSTDRFTMN
jgi:hypothetical protein